VLMLRRAQHAARDWKQTVLRRVPTQNLSLGDLSKGHEETPKPPSSPLPDSGVNFHYLHS